MQTNDAIAKQLAELSQAVHELKTHRARRVPGLEWGAMALAVLAAATVVYNAGTVSTRIEFLEKAVIEMRQEMKELRQEVKELRGEIGQMRVDIARLPGYPASRQRAVGEKN